MKHISLNVSIKFIIFLSYGFMYAINIATPKLTKTYYKQLLEFINIYKYLKIIQLNLVEKQGSQLE